MQHQLHSSIRNCGDQFPSSQFANRGYPLGPITVFQCPKTYIDKRTKSFIDAYDASQALKIPFAPTFEELSPVYVDLAETIEGERTLIRQQLNDLRRGGLNG